MSNSEIKSVTRQIAKLRMAKVDKIDGDTLFTALILFMFSGLKKKDISVVAIHDLEYNKGGELIGIRTAASNPAKKNIKLSRLPKKMLEQHIKNLKADRRYNFSQNLNLFPPYTGESGLRKLSRHLDKLKNDSFLNYDLNYLKNLGIIHYYNRCKRPGLTKQFAMKKTASYFGVTAKTITDSLGQKKQKKLNNTDRFLQHIEDLAKIDHTDTNAVMDYEEQGIKLIEKIRTSDSEKQKIIEIFKEIVAEYVQNPNKFKPNIVVGGSSRNASFDDVMKIIEEELKRPDAIRNGRITKAGRKMRKYFFDK